MQGGFYFITIANYVSKRIRGSDAGCVGDCSLTFDGDHAAASWPSPKLAFTVTARELLQNSPLNYAARG